MRYTEEERLILLTCYPLDAQWLEDADYPVFWNGEYDWIPPADDEYSIESA